MKLYVSRHLVPFFACMLLAASASAATVSGTISDTGGGGLAGMEVRLWEQTPKGFSIAYTQNTASGGTYSFGAVAAGTYKLDARMAPGITGHYGDTWYDVDPPSSNGLFASDADVLSIGSGDNLAGMDITLPLTGGFDGRVVAPNLLPLANMAVRAESRADYRYHHNDYTDGGACCGGTRHGRFSMRGLMSTSNGHDYRLLIYDHQGTYDLHIATGPYSVADAAASELGNFSMAAMPADPNEPNDTIGTATNIASLPYSSTDALIGPRGADVDWYCLDVQDGDRLMAHVGTDITVEGTTRPHPWLDPILSLWNSDGSQLILSNDDDPDQAPTLASAIDTGELSAGRYCFALSTYGDADWSGAQQITTGRYDFDVDMGNRRPTLEVAHDGTPTPVPPQTIAVDEEETLVLDLSWSDPDGDALVADVVHRDSAAQPVVQGTLTPGPNGGTYEWTSSQTAAEGSPYAIIFSVFDGEFTVDVEVNVEVNAVNVPPNTPVLESPIDGASVSEDAVALTVLNSTDRDGDELSYEFELHVQAPDDTPDQDGSAPEDDSGQTSWTTDPIAENTLVRWRARAFDGNAQSGYSPWSGWETFRVDVQNEPPEAPEILKPLPDELVVVTAPRISARVPEDPENDTLTIYFEIARDADFDDVVAASLGIEESAASTTVEWTTEPALDGGEAYVVRARAVDDRGAEGPWSDLVYFAVRAQELPGAPGFSGEFGEQCTEGYVFAEIPETLTVRNVDRTGDAISFELAILDWDSGPDAAPIYSTTVPQSDDEHTEIPVDRNALDQGGHYRIRVRTVFDDANSDWRECEAFVEGDGTTGDTDGSGDAHLTEEGCGCSASGSIDASWLALLLVFLGGFRLRRRRR